MKLIIEKIKYDRGFLFGLLLALISLSSCSEKVSFEQYVENELAKGVRHDSLIYGIHFGMTTEEFLLYCADMNRKKLFMPNPSGSAVRLELKEGFGASVQFDFFPVLQTSDSIAIVAATMGYRDFSYYNKSLSMENLTLEAKNFFENGYGGNKFFAIPHENKLLKHMYVKIDVGLLCTQGFK